MPITLPTMTVEFGAPPATDFPDANGWTCTLAYEGRTMTVPFYMGPALSGEPDVLDVLSSLFLDADAVNEDYYDWCDGIGMAPSRQAQQTYDACVEIGRTLRTLLGDDFDAISADERITER